MRRKAVAHKAMEALASELKLDPNDSLAVYVMRIMKIEEIYTFDKVFRQHRRHQATSIS